MKKLIALAAAAAAAVLFSAAPASAAGQFCYDVQVNANGQSVVAETGCQALP